MTVWRLHSLISQTRVNFLCAWDGRALFISVCYCDAITNARQCTDRRWRRRLEAGDIGWYQEKDLLRRLWTIYASFCSVWIVSGKIEIDLILASGAVVSHTATQPWGSRPHALVRGAVASHGSCRQTVFNSYNLEQWPLLLTWFNFNPSMDK